MATRKWMGQAKDVKQVDTVTIAGAWATNDTITCTIANIDFVVTIGTLTTTDQVATTLKQAWQGETLTDTSASASPTIAQGGGRLIPQFSEITATVSGSVVTLTADTAGKPFTLTVTESTAGSGTATRATATAATGKNFWDNQDNWSGNTVPVNNDIVVFDTGSVDLKYNLTTSIQPATFIKLKTYTGKIGLLETNVDNSAKPYPEYRTKYLTFNNNAVTTTYHIEQGEGTGTGLVRIDAGAGQVIFNSYGYGTRSVTGQPAQLFIGTHTSNEFNVTAGDLGIAFFPDEAANVNKLRVGNGKTGSATCRCNSGVTFNSCLIDVAGGACYIDSATAGGDIDITSGGTMEITGTGAHADIDVRNGTCKYQSSGTITALAIRSAGVFDRAGDMRSASITNVVNLYKGSTLKDPHGVLTLSNGFKLNGCTLDDVTLDFSTDRTYTVA